MCASSIMSLLSIIGLFYRAHLLPRRGSDLHVRHARVERREPAAVGEFAHLARCGARDRSAMKVSFVAVRRALLQLSVGLFSTLGQHDDGESSAGEVCPSLA